MAWLKLVLINDVDLFIAYILRHPEIKFFCNRVWRHQAGNGGPVRRESSDGRAEDQSGAYRRPVRISPVARPSLGRLGRLITRMEIQQRLRSQQKHNSNNSSSFIKLLEVKWEVRMSVILPNLVLVSLVGCMVLIENQIRRRINCQPY